MISKNQIDPVSSHADPITGEAGAHPLGVGAGAATGTLAGAAVGSIGGPIGAVVGGIVGAVAGGLAGKAAAEAADPTIAAQPPKMHGVGTTVGTAVGAMTGATLGAVGGPLGMVAGAAIGGAMGGAAGHTVAEHNNPTPGLHADPDEHPVAFGMGAVAGAASGVALGAAGGPLGMLAGGVVGSVVGAVAGERGGEALNPHLEDEYWRSNSIREPYAGGYSYDQLRHAYRIDWEAVPQYPGRSFDDVEPELQRHYESYGLGVPWADARYAARSAWLRAQLGIAGNS